MTRRELPELAAAPRGGPSSDGHNPAISTPHAVVRFGPAAQTTVIIIQQQRWWGGRTGPIELEADAEREDAPVRLRQQLDALLALAELRADADVQHHRQVPGLPRHNLRFLRVEGVNGDGHVSLPQESAGFALDLEVLGGVDVLPRKVCVVGRWAPGAGRGEE